MSNKIKFCGTGEHDYYVRGIYNNQHSKDCIILHMCKNCPSIWKEDILP